MIAETHRVSGRMRSVRTRVLRTDSTFPVLSMVTTPFETEQGLCTSMPFIPYGCTCLSFLEIKETECHGNVSLADTLIVAERRWQSIVVNTEILNLAHAV